MLPLGSYDVLICMDQLEQHQTLVNCKDKKIIFLTNEGIRKDQVVRRQIKLCHISTDQLGKCIRKSFQIYVVQVSYENSKEKISSLE